MPLTNLPVTKPKPDCGYFVDFMSGKVSGGRTPLIEYIIDDLVMKPIITDLFGREWVNHPGTIKSHTDREQQKAYLDNFIQIWYRLGYDFVRIERGAGFTSHHLRTADTAPGSDKIRSWADEHQGMIRNWDDFERYPWPEIDRIDFFETEYVNNHLPDGMGLITNHSGGMLEHLTSLMSYEGLAFAVHEDPALVQAIAGRVGGLMEKYYEHLLTLDRVIAIFPGDDMGFRTGTLLAPAHLRRFTLPWHKRFAELAHERGLPYFIHSCGNLEKIMDDLIDDVKIDGKHSYEDAIIPVEDFQARYGDRIAVLGGVDINLLSAGTETEIRTRVRTLVDTCGQRGRYALGSGNSIPSYVPAAHYLAMVDEALN